MPPVRAVLLDFYCTLVDLSDLVRSRGFDDFAWRLGLPLGPGELYYRYAEMISSEPAEDAASGFVPYRTSWLSAGRRLLAPFGLEAAAVQFADTYADMHATAVAFPGLVGVLPGFGRMEPNDWGLGFELRDAKEPHWTGTRNSPRTFGHFGRTGTFLWVDPDAGLALACLTDLTFGEWARETWPRVSDAVLAEAGAL